MMRVITFLAKRRASLIDLAGISVFVSLSKRRPPNTCSTCGCGRDFRQSCFGGRGKSAA